MGKDRFINQKLGKRTGRNLQLLKSRLAIPPSNRPQPRLDPRLPKKGTSREQGKQE